MNTIEQKEAGKNMLEAIRIGVCKYLVNEEFSMLWANDAFYAMCGYNEEEFHTLFHDSAAAFFHNVPEEFEKLNNVIKHALQSHGQQAEGLCHLPSKDGGLWVHMTGTFAEEQIDGIPVIYVIYTDVEDMVEVRMNLEQEHERLNLALQMEMKTVACIRLMYISNDMDSYMDQLLKEIGEFMHAERAYVFELQDGRMSNTFEWCNEGVESSIAFCQNMDVSLLAVWKDFIEAGKNVSIPDVERIRTEFPETYEVLHVQNIRSIALSPIVQNNKSTGFIGVDNPALEYMQNFSMLETISYFMSVAMEKKNLNDRLLHYSYYDDLTGVYNRNRYLQDLKQFNGKAVSLGIVYMDINGLKDINDHLGHTYGDKVLSEGASILKKVFDTASIYRIGGDEFVVFLQAVEEQTFLQQVEILKQAIVGSANCKGAIGYIWTPTCQNLSDKITDADEYMYQDKMQYYRKNPNSNRYRCCNDTVLQLADRSILMRALEEQQFEVYLQPKVNFKKELIGGEALIRYHDENGVLIMPNEFIPSLEEARTIRYVDFFAFEQVCRLLCRWHKEGRRLTPLSVNFSRYTLRMADFLGELERIWNKYQVPKKYLEIEIIENDESLDNEFLIMIMERIKRQGYAISIDDFGARYSNMALFINAQLDTLKLDRSMMQDLQNNRRSQMLISSLVQICHNLNMQLIVEGVETREQFDILKQLDCDGLQGYLIDRPIPIHDFEQKYIKTS